MTSEPKRTKSFVFPGSRVTRKAGISVGLALLIPAVLGSEAQAAEALVPPFPQKIVYPADFKSGPGFSGDTLTPSHPVFDFAGVPGWIQGKKVTNSMKVTIPKYEMLVIRGSKVKDQTIVIPAGGLYFDASPARGELPMTGSQDYFFGKRYYFVDYDARIHVKKDAVVRSGQLTAVGNHLYTLLSPPIPKVVLDPVINWKTFDGVSIRPWAFSVRWTQPSSRRPNQKPMTYLQGVIRKIDKKNGAVTFASLSGTSIHSEWWAKTLVYEGDAHENQRLVKENSGIVIDRIDNRTSSVTFHFIMDGKKGPSRTLTVDRTSTLPENPKARKKMIAIDASTAVVLWPHDAISNGSVKLWVYAGVEQWLTNRHNFGFEHMAYFPIACPIAHHIGAMVYNTSPLVLKPGSPVSLWGGYARIEVVSIQGQDVQFKISSRSGSTPIFRKNGNIDSVIGGGRAAHGILSTLDTTDLALDKDLTVKK